MRSFLGPESEPWAREVESRLRAIETPLPRTAGMFVPPNAQAISVSRMVAMDYSQPDGSGLSLELTLARPVWSKVAAIIGMDYGEGREFIEGMPPSTYNFSTEMSAPPWDSWQRVWHGYLGAAEGEVMQVADSPFVRVRVVDEWPLSAHESGYNSLMSFVLVWLP